MSLSLESFPVIAILRGIQPEEALPVGRALSENGIGAIEVPLNSPDALLSIEQLSATLGGTCLCGAGTVTDPGQVAEVKAAGGSLIVAPNTDARVIRSALDCGMTVLPGFATATEAFAALAAGARNLKLFPATTYGTGHLKALRAVLPRTTRIYAVGGIGLQTLAEWARAGIDGVAIGTELFQPGLPPEEVGRRAAAIITAFHDTESRYFTHARGDTAGER